MTSPPNDSSSDADIKQITADHSFGTLLVVDTSPLPSVRESANATAVTSAASPTNAGVTVSSSSSYEHMSQFISLGAHENTRLKGKGPNNKGKGVQRSLDWHIATHNASESDREGKWSTIGSINM